MLNPKSKFYRWGPIDAYPLFLYYSIEPAFAPLKKLFGTTYSESLIIFKNGKATWLLDLKELLKESKKFVETVIMDQKGSRRYFDIWNKNTEKLTTFFKRLDNISLVALPETKFLTLFQTFTKTYYRWFAVTISHELVTSSLEPFAASRLKQYFQNDQDEKYTQAFAILTSPETLSFYRREERDLLRILLLNKRFRPKALKRHQRNYYWIYNSYARGQILNLTYFQGELEKKSLTDYKKILQEIETYSPQMHEKKYYLMDQLHLSPEDRKTFALITKFAELLDERKQINFVSDHYLELFVQEFARRTSKKPEDIKLLLPYELTVPVKELKRLVLNDRRKCFVLSCRTKQIVPFEGKSAAFIANQFDETPSIENTVLQGVVASQGNVRHFRGTAKVVLSIKEINKVKEGDVLITTMTSPDFVIGMKKAGAIITDVGGILSHAAIVSREFGKPCIVGTEIATRTIHDGDVVELHCAKGVVRILKS